MQSFDTTLFAVTTAFSVTCRVSTGWALICHGLALPRGLLGVNFSSGVVLTSCRFNLARLFSRLYGS